MVKVAVGEKDGLRLQTLVLEPLGQLLPLAAGVDDAAGGAARLVEDIAVGAQLTQGEDVDLHEITSKLCLVVCVLLSIIRYFGAFVNIKHPDAPTPGCFKNFPAR